MSTKATIYKPKGKAGEYAAFACNFYVGCSNGCEYCYNRRFPLLSQDRPTLRKVFTSETDALAKFVRELHEADGSVREDIRREGVTFTFTSDPMLPECITLTAAAVRACLERDVPAIILTKCASWKDDIRMREVLAHPKAKELLAIGLTVTGHDEMEPHADTNRMRIDLLKMLHREGYITYASIEPVFDYGTALKMVRECAPFCRQLKIGLKAGCRKSRPETVEFIDGVRTTADEHGTKIYWKESVRKCVGGESPEGKNFVEADWNIVKSPIV